MQNGWVIAIVIVVGLVCLIIGATVALLIYIKYAKSQKITIKQETEKFKEETEKLRESAVLEAKSLRKEALIEAKDEQHRLRRELAKEQKDARSDIQRNEARLVQKENILDKKEGTIDSKLNQIEQTKKEIDEQKNQLKLIDAELKDSHNKMIVELEKVSMLTAAEAKEILMDSLLDSVKKFAEVQAKEIIASAQENAEKEAKNIIALSIQKCAADHSSEVTVSVVALPNDDMKGRIIGRVGRNIRAFESSTGVDLIIDDTPDVVTLSGFDPIRREVAKLTLEKLVLDGRIHPARIEEMVEKSKEDVARSIKEAGEQAIFDVGIYGIHPEIVNVLGRLKFRTSYGQNVLKHSLEVSYLAGLMATQLGADVKVAKRAGLLHDIGKALDHEIEGTHIQIGVNLATKYKENKDVIHAIAAHHNDIEPETIEAILVQAADAISSARPGARRESLDNYVKRLESLECIANSFVGVEQSYAIQAGREIRVIVKPNEVNEAATVFLSRDIASKLEAELDYPGQIKVSVIRETRSVEYAK